MSQVIFILTVEVPYEGGWPIGVYSTEAAARAAAIAYRADDPETSSYSYNRITVLDLDALYTSNGHTINLR